MLIVDDDADVRAVTHDVLVDAGFTVEQLGTFARRAVDDALSRFAPDVVLLDSAGETTYGPSWGLAARLRADPRHIAVVMFTAHATEAREARDAGSERSARAGFAGVVEKPFHIDELVAEIQEAVRRELV